MPDAMAAAPTRLDREKLARLRREWCEQNGQRADEFAARVPITYQYLLRLETGRQDSPSLEVLGNLARVLGITPGELLTSPITDEDYRELANIGRQIKADAARADTEGATAEGAA